jgi:hypothetical protein
VVQEVARRYDVTDQIAELMIGEYFRKWVFDNPVAETLLCALKPSGVGNAQPEPDNRAPRRRPGHARGRNADTLLREERLHTVALDSNGAYRDWTAKTAFAKAKVRFPEDEKLFDIKVTQMSEVWKSVKKKAIEAEGRRSASDDGPIDNGVY